MSRRDWYSNDVEAAAGFERHYGTLHDDDRPTRAELEAEAREDGDDQ